jgi:hypothetical protein
VQDRYAGDIGDYVKLGLLRAISVNRKLGVAWYRTPDESDNNDGNHTTYLDQPEKYSAVDQELFYHLKNVVRDERSIKSLLPALGQAVSFDEALDLASIPSRQRRDWRAEWFKRATQALSAQALSECDIVFADPDNGIVDNSDTRKGTKNFGKQIPLSEVKAMANGRCAVIYHHNTRRAGGHDLEVDHWLSEIEMPSIAVRATAFSPRTFFVINPDLETAQRIAEFCEKWKSLRVRLHKPQPS